MANKKISEFPVTTSLAGNDAFLINHLGSTNTVSFSSLSAAITNDSIKLPSGATGGQVLTYNGSTSTWVASAVPKELPSTATTGQVLTYNGSTSTWVASAAIGTTLLSSNGYITLSNGLIMQWGSVSCDIANSASATFPITFPTTVYILVSTPQSMGTSSQTGDGVSNKTTSGFTQYNGAGTARVFNWYAIGV